MDKNLIKKELYKQKPDAEFEFIRKGVAYYSALLFEENGVDLIARVMFEIPVNDMGDADFHHTMDAKLLIRYIADGEH